MEPVWPLAKMLPALAARSRRTHALESPGKPTRRRRLTTPSRAMALAHGPVTRSTTLRFGSSALLPPFVGHNAAMQPDRVNPSRGGG